MKNKLLVTLGIFICALFLNGFEPYDDLKAELILDAKPLLGGVQYGIEVILLKIKE